MATPPLSFLVHHTFLSALGSSEWALRLPSALAGLAGIAVVFFAGARMFGKEAAAMSALILAIHPLHLSMSTDARPYAMAVVFASGAVWAFSELLRSDRWVACIAWSLCAAGLLYAQFVFVPLLAAQAAAYAILRQRGHAMPRPAGKLFAAVGAAAALSLPLVPQIRADLARRSSLIWPIEVGPVAGLADLFPPAPVVAAAAIVLAIVLSRRFLPGTPPGSDAGRPPAGPDVLVLSLCCFLPVVALGILSRLCGMDSLGLPRYHAAYVVPATLLIGWALTRPRRPVDRAVACGTFLAIGLLTHVVPVLAAGRSFNANLGAQDWRGAGQVLRAESRDGDLVLLRSGLVESNGLFDGSFPDRCLSYLGSPLPELYLGRRIDPVILPATFATDPTPASYDAMIGRRLAGHDRIWLVLLAPPNSDAYLDSVLAFVRRSTSRRFTIVRSEVEGQVLVALLSPAG
jgi:mannosyltransferase